MAAVIVDSSAVYALADRSEPAHDDCVRALESMGSDTLVISPFALQEADYLVRDRLGRDAERSLLADVAGGGIVLAPMSPDDVGSCLRVVERYRDLEIGLADASTVVLADRARTRRIFTLDRRHFSALRPLSGGRFQLLPS